MEPLPLWEAAKLEMEEYQFVASAGLQPKSSVLSEIAVKVAISGLKLPDAKSALGQGWIADVSMTCSSSSEG